MAGQSDWWAADVKAAKASTGGREDLERRGKEASIASSQTSAAASTAASQRARAEFILKYGMPPEEVTPTRMAPGDATKTGEDYLATLPRALATQVQMLAEGRMAFPSGPALRSPKAMELIAAASQYDPSLDAANAATRVATRKDFTSGMSARNLTALNTAVGHLARLKKNAEALNNTWSPKINEPLNYVQSEWLGDPRVNNFNAVRDAFATELAKVFKGTGAPSLAEIEDWKKRANSAQSPEQLMGFVHEAADLLQSRINAVGDTYNRGMGQSSDPITLLTPKSQKLFTELSGATSEGGAAPTTGVFEATPEGAVVAGEDVKGWRFSPDTEQAISAYYGDPKATAEGYAAMVADRAVAEGRIPAEQRDSFYQSNLSSAKDFFALPPEERAKTSGIDYSAIDKAATENAGLGASVAQGLRNVPESAVNLVTGVAAPATDLLKSVAAGKREGIYEAVPNIVGDITGLSNTGTADALGKSLAERYGGGANIARSLIRDPLGVAGDVSMLATLGGAGMARAPGAIGRAGEVLSTAGRAIDPLSGVVALGTEGLPALARKYLPEGGGELAKNVATEVAAFPSGVGGSTLREGYAAGKTRGRAGAPTPQSEAFTSAMRGEGDAAAAVDLARDAVANLRDAASRRYTEAMAQFGQTPVPLSPDNLRMTMANMRPKNFDAMAGAPHRPADHLAWQQMNDTVEHYLKQAEADPSLLEPLAVDQFKQDLYSIGSKIGGATDRDAARIAGNAYREVRKMLTDHDPVYANVMKDYADAAQEAASLESGFSLTSNRTKPVNVDAASRKLHSIMRNNANTNYGQRAAQGERLAELDPTGTLMPTLAGQSASSWPPRGMRGNVEAAGLLGEAMVKGGPLALINPQTLAMLAPTSPRIMGEVAHGAGRMVGAGQRMAEPWAEKLQGLGELYNKYPEAALRLSRASEYSDETEQQKKDAMRRKYGIGVVPYNVSME